MWGCDRFRLTYLWIDMKLNAQESWRFEHKFCSVGNKFWIIKEFQRFVNWFLTIEESDTKNQIY